MFPTDGLSHGEIVVVAGIFAFGMIAITSVIGGFVAYLATREAKPATVVAPAPAAPPATETRPVAMPTAA